VLFVGAVAAVVAVCVVGSLVIDRLVPARRSSDPWFQVISDASSPESRHLVQGFFGDDRGGPEA
jgi:hypothetical protein